MIWKYHYSSAVVSAAPSVRLSALFLLRALSSEYVLEKQKEITIKN